ncbi:cytochrome P450 [Xylariaceae sp. FL0804]|nr:cytochrome P450 [Xylariaceae sp. FL0804]
MDAPSLAGLRDLGLYQLIVLALASLSFVVLLRGLRHPLSHIPGPWYTKWTNVVFTYHLFRGQGPVYVKRLHDRYGPVVRINLRQVDVSDGEVAKQQIHKVKADFIKSDFYRPGPGGKINIFNLQDPVAHTRHRKLLSQPLSERGLKSMEPQVEEKVRKAIQGMTGEMKTRGAVDIFKWWMFFTTDVVSQLSFGGSFDMLVSGKKNTYIEDLERVGVGIALNSVIPSPIFFLLSLFPIPTFRELRRGDKRLTARAEQMLQKYRNVAMSDANARPMLFTKIMKGETDGEETMSAKEIVNDAELMIIAGSDTTSTTLTYLTWAACRHPEIRSKLVKEVQGLRDDFTDDDLRALPYMNQCILEALRRYPVAPAALPRDVPKEGALIKGHWLPGGSVVTTHNWCLHMDEEAFPDPEVFDPSRWETPTKRMKDFYMPFSSGSRNCIGIHLAQVEMRLGIAHFFRAFPNAGVSTLEGMQDKDMEQLLYFVSGPRSHRCLIKAC